MKPLSFAEFQEAINNRDPVKVVCKMKTHAKFNCIGTVIKVERDWSTIDFVLDGYPQVAIIRWDNGSGHTLSRFKRLDLLERFIGNPNQKCMGCWLPAPHSNSNVDGGGYICSFCKVMKELI